MGELKRIVRHYISFFDIRMLKKHYCLKCGNKLKIKLVTTEEKTYENRLYTNYELDSDFYYRYDKCKYYIKYKDQRKLLKEINKLENKEDIDINSLINKYKQKIKDW